MLTGEVGTGKTTLCRNLLADLPENVDVALILNPNINRRELLETVCDELKIDCPEDQSKKKLLDSINDHLLTTYAQNRHTVLIIDEAQLLSHNVLEQVRLLTNLETTKSKLLQIILIGQPELSDLLSRNDLRQLSQRVTARYHLPAISRDEIQDYINFRLGVAGCKKPLFSAQSLKLLHKLSEGIPRKINVLADHALLSAYAKSQLLVDAKTLRESSKDVLVKPSSVSKSPLVEKLKSPWLAALAAFIALNLSLWWWFSDRDSSLIVDTQSVQGIDRNTLASQSVETAGAQGDVVNLGNSEAASSSDDIIQRLSASTGKADAPITDSVDQGIAKQGLAQIESEKIDLSQLSGSTNVVNTISKPKGVVPGSVVISEEFLDADEGLELTGDFADAGSQAGLVTFEPPVPVAAPAYLATSAFGRVLDVSADRTGRIAAFINLAAAWDANLPKSLIGPLCEELDQRGVACLPVSSWATLLRFNRPTIMVVKHDSVDHRIILYKLESGNASVLVGDQSYQLPISELRDRWSGNAMVFWRPSELGSQFLQVGDDAQAVQGLRAKLNAILRNLSFAPLNNLNSTVFDAQLASRVSELQRQFGILADGKIGHETYLLINELLGAESVPVLIERG